MLKTVSLSLMFFLVMGFMVAVYASVPVAG